MNWNEVFHKGGDDQDSIVKILWIRHINANKEVIQVRGSTQFNFHIKTFEPKWVNSVKCNQGGYKLKFVNSELITIKIKEIIQKQ